MEPFRWDQKVEQRVEGVAFPPGVVWMPSGLPLRAYVIESVKVYVVICMGLCAGVHGSGDSILFLIGNQIGRYRQ